MPKLKTGEQITWKEFFKRWGEGIDGITPTQKLNTQITGTTITLIGILLGLVFSVIGYKTLWWLGIILLGASINTVIQLLGLKQQKKAIVKHEENCEEMSLDELMSDDEVELNETGGKK
jgi:hypothetical protein